MYSGKRVKSQVCEYPLRLNLQRYGGMVVIQITSLNWTRNKYWKFANSQLYKLSSSGITYGFDDIFDYSARIVFTMFHRSFVE